LDRAVFQADDPFGSMGDVVFVRHQDDRFAGVVKRFV
jgi:hypothetical protein